MNFDSLNEILITPQNKMTATYSLIGVGMSDVYTEIDIVAVNHSNKETEINIRAIENNDKYVDINVMYRGNSFVYTEIQPIGFEQIPIEIEVGHGNRMWGLFEIQKPPVLTTIHNPSQDSLTRGKNEYRYINYGNSSSLTVGNHYGDDYRSFVKFDLTKWQPQFVLLGAKLRLYYSGVVQDDTVLELAKVGEDWTEFGITRMNEPKSTGLVIDEYYNNDTDRYVEFEITDYVLDWIDNSDENYGVMIGIADDSEQSIINFRSRESTRPPELIINYYDGRVYSAGRSRVQTEIFVWNVGRSDMLTEIEVGSTIGDSIIRTEIYVHRPEVPVESDIGTQIVVSRLDTFAEIEISKYENSEIGAILYVRSLPLSNHIDTEIMVNKPYQFAEIFVKYDYPIPVELVVQKNEASDVFTEVTVNREQINTDIYVKHTECVVSEIIVQKDSSSYTMSEIIVNRDSIFTDIDIRSRDQNQTNAEIFVKYQDTIETEIIVNVFSDILTEINVIHASRKKSDIVVTKPTIYTEITVPYWDDSDIPMEIRPRILLVSDMNAEITVDRSAQGYAYVFII